MWNVRHDLLLLRGIIRHKPLGMHEHFRMLAIQDMINEGHEQPVSIAQIRHRLLQLYDMNALEYIEMKEYVEFELPEEIFEANKLYLEKYPDFNI